MPIEFYCPYCDAMIRVPDKAKGGKGKCPKCSARITVPKKSQIKPVEVAADEEELELPYEDEPVVLQEANSAADDVPSEANDTSLAEGTFDPDALTDARIGKLPVERPVPLARKLKKKRKPVSMIWIYGAAIGVIGLGVAGYLASTTVFVEQLKGEFIAGSAEILDLNPVVIDKARIKLAEDEVAELLKKLELSPVPLNSNSMQVRLTGTAKGLEVSVTAGNQMRYYRVNVQGNDAVEKYLSQHASELDDERNRDIDREITAFFIAYQNVLAKKAQADSITVYRDALALPSLVRGLGHQLVAAYGRSLYRCVYEDREGGLYFLLPAGVKEFEVMGRTHADGRVVVPAEFRVKVQGEIVPPKRVEEKKEPKKPLKPIPKANADDKEMGEGAKGEK